MTRTIDSGTCALPPTPVGIPFHLVQQKWEMGGQEKWEMGHEKWEMGDSRSGMMGGQGRGSS